MQRWPPKFLRSLLPRIFDGEVLEQVHIVLEIFRDVAIERPVAHDREEGPARSRMVLIAPGSAQALARMARYSSTGRLNSGAV